MMTKNNPTVHVLNNGQSRDCECCPDGAYRAVMTRQNFPYMDGSEQVMLEAIVPVWTCAECDDAYTDDEAEVARHSAVCRYLGRLTPEELVRLRVARGMSREQWAEYTALGIASLKRWEKGSLIQSAATDRFLRLLSDDAANARYVAANLHSQVRGRPIFITTFSEREIREAATFELRPRRVSACT